METQDHKAKEIDLRELFSTLWADKYRIAIVATICFMVGVIYLHTADRVYTVSMTVKQVGAENSGPDMRGLEGLASLAGISGSSNNDFDSYRILLLSEEVSAKILNDKELVQEIFSHEWDAEAQAFVSQQNGIVSAIKGAVKFVLTGQSRPDYTPPNAARLADYLATFLDIEEDLQSGFLKLTMEHGRPELARKVISVVTRETDELLKEKFIIESEGALEFYSAKLKQVQSRDRKDALVSLIMNEEKTLMLASRESAFIAESIIGPKVSLGPTSPSNGIVLLLSILIGWVLGVMISVLRGPLFRNDK